MRPSKKEILCINYALKLKHEFNERVNQPKASNFIHSLFTKKSSVKLKKFELCLNEDLFSVSSIKSIVHLWNEHGIYSNIELQSECLKYWIFILFDKIYDVEFFVHEDSQNIKKDQKKLLEEANRNGTLSIRKNYGSLIDRFLKKIDAELGVYEP
jgi:hypothetical protein